MPIRRLHSHLSALAISTFVVIAGAACGKGDSNGAGGTGAAGATTAIAGPGAGPNGSTGVGNGSTGAGPNSTSGSGGAGTGLSAKYPGDVGIENDPDFVWGENFEEGSATALFARYDDKKTDGFALDTDKPTKSVGQSSGKLTASAAGPNAVDFYKELAPGYEELYVRYYAKYQANAPWHHTGVWMSGYNPTTLYPNPQAGLKPTGDDRFSIALEPAVGGMATPRMDFYNYWMQMHSWMDVPMGSTAYYGNAVVHDPTLTAKEQWQCFELHIMLNPDPTSAAGAELGLWVDDQSVIQFTDTTPTGYWVKDKFCPDAAVGTECTMYKPANPTLVPLDLQLRSSASLKLDSFWPQNYITDTGAGSVWYDDMVVAKSRIGCLQ